VQLARTVPSGDGGELRNARVLRALGPTGFDRLIPVRSADPVITVPRANGLFPSQPGRTRRDERIGFTRSRRFVRGLRIPREVLATSAARGGSNGYAIRAPGGRTLLSSSPQLGFSIPELFVELEVHAPGLDVRGVTAPGIPVLAIGHNGRIAWGTRTRWSRTRPGTSAGGTPACWPCDRGAGTSGCPTRAPARPSGAASCASRRCRTW